MQAKVHTVQYNRRSRNLLLYDSISSSTSRSDIFLGFSVSCVPFCLVHVVLRDATLSKITWVKFSLVGKHDTYTFVKVVSNRPSFAIEVGRKKRVCVCVCVRVIQSSRRDSIST